MTDTTTDTKPTIKELRTSFDAQHGAGALNVLLKQFVLITGKAFLAQFDERKADAVTLGKAHLKLEASVSKHSELLESLSLLVERAPARLGQLEERLATLERKNG